MEQTDSGTAGTVGDGELTSYRLRRERELSSLYQTARSLTALGEVDEVLRSIVRHAHELIGSDFVYLSLLDAEGYLTLKASAGTISSEFSSARVPRGRGLGGRVLQHKAPFWVSNYRQAQALPHDPTFDLLVPREGLTALLGVPLLVGEEAIGALFAADRTERPFEKDEVALFSAFASHAAVALNNARLYEQTRVSLRRLEDAYRMSQHDLVTWTAGLTGLDLLDAYQLISQAGTAPVGNVCDPNYTMLAKVRKQYLGGADAYEGIHARLRRMAHEVGR